MKEELKKIIEGKRILVTGGTGSIGGEIVRQLLNYKPQVVRILSNDEFSQFNMKQELGSRLDVRYLLGDIRDKDRLKIAMSNVDIVFHAAALKHVPFCEENPYEAVKTNIIGTQNLIDVALEEEVENFINISTDKVINAINVMGATKLVAERITISAEYYKGNIRTKFYCVRFGNVLASRGSVIPIFKLQIEKGGPVTITNPKMTRFVMSIPQAVNLVLNSLLYAHGGEIFILKMPSIRIIDLAQVLIEDYSKEIGLKDKRVEVKYIGERIGEKVDEELMTEVESANSYETEDMFIVYPAHKKAIFIPQTLKIGSLKLKKTKIKRYTSKDQQVLSKEEIRKLLAEIKY